MPNLAKLTWGLIYNPHIKLIELKKKFKCIISIYPASITIAKFDEDNKLFFMHLKPYTNNMIIKIFSCNQSNHHRTPHRSSQNQLRTLSTQACFQC